MANRTASSSNPLDQENSIEEEFDLIYGSESGWVEARTSCDHLASLSADLTHIPTPDTPCNRCQHPSENWLCLSCKDVLCSRYVNKHMLQHYQQTSHSVALSISDLSFWCWSCNAYLDAQVILQLRPVYEIAYILKFGESPPDAPRARHGASSSGRSQPCRPVSAADRLDQMARDIRDINTSLRQQQEQHQSFYQRVYMYMVYQMDYNQALSQYLSQCILALGASPPQFPSPPVLSDYPPNPPTDSQDEDAE